MNKYIVSLSHLYDDLRKSIDFLKKDKSRILKSRAVVEKALKDGKTYYGINTGFGILATTRINPQQLVQLQKNLVLSHAVGVDELVPKEISHLMLQLKIHALGLGYSGISKETLERLILFEKMDLIPTIPSKGSVGASGDLAPLAHMSLPLIGYGSFWDKEGKKVVSTKIILKKHRLEPIKLQAKDGLSLVNGTQLMCAYGAHVLQRTFQFLKMCDIIAAMSLEALQGSAKPFDSRIHQIRPHQGQRDVAKNIRVLLTASQILISHRDCGKVQDPYSIRCVPQVHGASRDALRYVASVIETEINSVTDNPLVFENGDILSGGNFHGQPLALALDFAAIALAELASISERRIYLLVSGHDGLPKMLVRESGINSGFMILQYTAAALVSENKILCHPASVDSIPTCMGQEDHVSMGSIGALKLLQVFKNVEKVLAIELLTAAQALDYRNPLKPGYGVELAHRYIRSTMKHSEEDHFFQDELHQSIELVQDSKLIATLEQKLGKLS